MVRDWLVEGERNFRTAEGEQMGSGAGEGFLTGLSCFGVLRVAGRVGQANLMQGRFGASWVAAGFAAVAVGFGGGGNVAGGLFRTGLAAQANEIHRFFSETTGEGFSTGPTSFA